ncbi:MAG TPA: hypothetical protein VHD63_20375 [Ktedonobacteraceae bacterium]|nr:hypothetical protein [Ktedonobacteraceae bacterium]
MAALCRGAGVPVFPLFPRSLLRRTFRLEFDRLPVVDQGPNERPATQECRGRLPFAGARGVPRLSSLPSPPQAAHFEDGV